MAIGDSNCEANWKQLLSFLLGKLGTSKLVLETNLEEAMIVYILEREIGYDS